jgi:hypothetical protein
LKDALKDPKAAKATIESLEEGWEGMGENLQKNLGGGLGDQLKGLLKKEY